MNHFVLKLKMFSSQTHATTNGIETEQHEADLWLSRDSTAATGESAVTLSVSAQYQSIWYTRICRFFLC